MIYDSRLTLPNSGCRFLIAIEDVETMKTKYPKAIVMLAASSGELEVGILQRWHL